MPSSSCNPTFTSSTAASPATTSTRQLSLTHRHQRYQRPFIPVITSPNPHRLIPPRSGPFDSFLDNMRNLASTPIQPSSSSAYGDEEEEYPEEEDNTFVQLNPNSTGSVDGTSEETFGPLAMLAVGFLEEEFAFLQDILDEMGAAEVQLVPCTSTLLDGTLGEALSMDPLPAHEPPISEGTQRVVFLSGMYASEVIEVVAALRESDLPECAFAAAVPRSWGRQLRELVDDVHADHAAMAERRRTQQAAAEGEG